MSTPDKQPLVMLSGLAADWDPEFLGCLQESHEPIPIETSGATAHEVLERLDELGLQDTAITGWSTGGFLAQQVAELQPGRVLALVLLATDGGGPKAARADPGALAAPAGWYETPQPGGSIPVLVAHGNDDTVIPAVNADKLAQKWPAARVERFPGCGHDLTAKAPGELAAVIRSFLS